MIRVDDVRFRQKGQDLQTTDQGQLEDADTVMSVALVPLRNAEDGPAFGLLVLGSPDPQRFDATMGTEFLSRIAELASAALVRLK
mgnify:CR=1 FL=1